MQIGDKVWIVNVGKIFEGEINNCADKWVVSVNVEMFGTQLLTRDSIFPTEQEALDEIERRNEI